MDPNVQNEREPHDSNSVEENKIVAPKWPYDHWKTVKISRVPINTAEKKQGIETPHHLHSMSIIHSNFALKELLNKLSSQTSVLEDDKNARVNEDVKKLMKSFGENLKTAGFLFEGCRLIEAGSVAEETKIKKSDEFDYLLVLDRLSDRKAFQLHLSGDYFKFSLNQESQESYEELQSKIPHLLDFDDDEVFLHYNMKTIILKSIMDVFDSSLYFGWKRLSTNMGDVCSSRIATTVHLFTETHNMDVDIDICICFQISPNDLKNAAGQEQVTNTTENPSIIFSYLHFLNQGASFELFAIIGDGEHLSRMSQTRITAPLLELSRFRYYGQSDGRVKTYKLGKCLVSNFFPKYTNVFGCKRCCHSLVKSYYLKNIILFMIHRYTDDSLWIEDKICTRVLEMFTILKQCVVGRQNEVASISVCCLPGELQLDDISTNNPFIKEELNKDSNFLFTPDSHKPKHEISSSPSYENHLSTRNHEANQMMKKWFQHLNKEHWSTYELISDFENLLLFLASTET